MLGVLQGLLGLTFPTDCLACGEFTNGEPYCEACVRLVVPRAGTRCGCCDTRTSGLHRLCGRCLTEPPSFQRVFGLFDYIGPVGDAIRAGKYEARPEALPTVADLVRKYMPRELRASPPEAVVPVPLHPKRLARRGVDVPAVLGRTVARALQVSCASRAVQRTRDTRPQAGLSERARRDNLAGAFAPGRTAMPRDVLIVDDVMTTGATARAVASVARLAGAVRIRVLVAAVADRTLP